MGGIIGQSGIAYDQYGNATGQINLPLPTYSWEGHDYQIASTDLVLANPLFVAASFGAFQGANPSRNNTAVKQPWYPPLRSCPGAPVPCPQEAIRSALAALKTLLQSPCPACGQYIFNKFPGFSQAGLLNFLSLPPRLWDGMGSYAPGSTAFCPSGILNAIFCSFPDIPNVRDFMTANQSDAASQTPADKGKGMQTFFNPATGICNVLSVQNPQPSDRGVLNQATLLHEALHGYLTVRGTLLPDTSTFDVTLLSAFLNNTNLPSSAITYYLEQKVIPGGAQGALACQN
jgi:hypothetical protein